ncbi:MAG: hypothetical protein ACE5HN_02745 [Nitrospiria bacterium]
METKIFSSLSKMTAVVISFAGLILFTMVPASEARRSGQNPVQTGKNNCRLAKGIIKMPGYPLYNLVGTQVATKRVTISWRYVDANCDGVMTWGLGPADGSDYLRIVPRTIYDFTFPLTVVGNEVQVSTHHFGPFDNAIPPGAYRETAFREIHHDDLFPGLPAPGDFTITQGMDGLPIPGLTGKIVLAPNAGLIPGDNRFVPGSETRWRAKYFLEVDPLLLPSRTIPAGAFMFFDSQLNAYNIVPSSDGSCEFGFSEEDWINVSSGGPIQDGPNTLTGVFPDGTPDPNVIPIPVHFLSTDPAIGSNVNCTNNTIPE